MTDEDRKLIDSLSAKCKPGGYGFYLSDSQVARLLALAEQGERATEALRGVPDPEEKGYCDSCSSRLELRERQITYRDGSTGVGHYWEHKPTCWFGKVQSALAGESPPPSLDMGTQTLWP